MEQTVGMQNTLGSVETIDVQEDNEGNVVLRYKTRKNILLYFFLTFGSIISSCSASLMGGTAANRMDVLGQNQGMGSSQLIAWVIALIFIGFTIKFFITPRYAKLHLKRGQGLHLPSGDVPFADIEDFIRPVVANPNLPLQMTVKLKNGQEVPLALVRNTNVALALTDTLSKMNN